MKITYKNNAIRKICTIAQFAERKLGRNMADKIHQRIDEISGADTIEQMIQYSVGKCHPLTGDREGEYAMHLVEPYRLVFEKRGNEVQIAHIIEIVDYH